MEVGEGLVLMRCCEGGVVVMCKYLSNFRGSPGHETRARVGLRTECLVGGVRTQVYVIGLSDESYRTRC